MAFAVFIICWGIAGTRHVITKATQTNRIQVAVIGTLLAMPLVVAMTLIFDNRTGCGVRILCAD